MDELGPTPPSSEITSESHYLRRREFLRNAALFTATATTVAGSLRFLTRGRRVTDRTAKEPATLATLDVAGHVEKAGGEEATPERDVTT